MALRLSLDPLASPNEDIDGMFVGAPYYRCPSPPREPHNVHYVAIGFAFLSPRVVDECGTNNPPFRRGPMRALLVPLPAQTLYLTDGSGDFRIGPRRHALAANGLYPDTHASGRLEGYLVDTSSWDDGVYVTQ